jgi:hypothetical protein
VFTGKVDVSKLNGGTNYCDSIRKFGEVIEKAKGALDKVDNTDVRETLRSHINNAINACQHVIQLRVKARHKHFGKRMKKVFGKHRMFFPPIQIKYVAYACLDKTETCKAAAQRFGGETKATEKYTEVLYGLKHSEEHKSHEIIIDALVWAQKAMGEVLPSG